MLHHILVTLVSLILAGAYSYFAMAWPIPVSLPTRVYDAINMIRMVTLGICFGKVVWDMAVGGLV